MGLFRRSPSDDRVRSLVAGATDGSVTAAVLSRTGSPGAGGHDYLNDAPLVDYLVAGEQPHFVVPLVPVGGSGVFVDGGENLLPNSRFRTMVAVTDRRVLIVVGDADGDRETAIAYPDVTGVELTEECGDGTRRYGLELTTGTATYRIQRSTADRDAERVRKRFRRAGEFVAAMVEKE